MNRGIPAPPIWTISELNRYIKAKMDTDATLQSCMIRGEISNFTRHSSGHLYFTLKDDGSRIRAVMFKGAARSLPFLPKDGMKVIAGGSVSVFERDGSYQMYVEQMQPDGIGSLHLAFEQLKRRLEEEGLFQAALKKPLPQFPALIGVVTSPTGAAVRDIITTIRRRYPVAHVLLFPVLVQGPGAAASIAKAIREFNRMAEADVLIVGRGGGSLEELWAFNEEEVARAIFSSQIPVISAVGHETDFTIADFVADVRAATPTAAAELAVPQLLELSGFVEDAKRRMIMRIRQKAAEQKRRLEELASRRVLTDPALLVERRREWLNHAVRQLELSLTKRSSAASRSVQEWTLRLQSQKPSMKIKSLQERLTFLESRAEAAAGRVLASQQNRFEMILTGLAAYNPLDVMRRGYSLTYKEALKKAGGSKRGHPQLVRSLKDVNLGDIVAVRLADGWLDCQVWGIREENEDDGAGESGNDRRGERDAGKPAG